MGQKTNPVAMRVAVSKDWRSKWYANRREFAPLLLEDLKIRELVKKRLEQAAVPKIFIERYANRVRVTVHTARPGVVIGRKGESLDKLREELHKLTGGKEIFIEPVEVKQPELDAQLVAENVAVQLERRISHRRAMKKAVQTAMALGALGIRINCGGRLGGSEIARREWYREGKLPLHNLRADIDFGFAEANTVYGKIGVKVWICRGIAEPQQKKLAVAAAAAATAAATAATAAAAETAAPPPAP
jgi:small subunit ribosomal protein S3